MFTPGYPYSFLFANITVKLAVSFLGYVTSATESGVERVSYRFPDDDGLSTASRWLSFDPTYKLPGCRQQCGCDDDLDDIARDEGQQTSN